MFAANLNSWNVTFGVITGIGFTIGFVYAAARVGRRILKWVHNQIVGSVEERILVAKDGGSSVTDAIGRIENNLNVVAGRQEKVQKKLEDIKDELDKVKEELTAVKDELYDYTIVVERHLGAHEGLH